MAVDVSKIPNNNKFDPVREAILQLQEDIQAEGQIAYDGNITISKSTGSTIEITSGSFSVNQSNDTNIIIGIDDSGYYSTSGGTIDGDVTITGSLTIDTDLTVSGTTTYINTQHLNIGDNIVTLNADLPSDTAPTENAGIEINRGSSTNVDFLWNETSNEWDLQTYSGLRIYKFGTGSNTLTIEAGSTAGDAVIALTPNTTGTGGVIQTTNERPIVFQPYSTTKMVIASGGDVNIYDNLGIGRTGTPEADIHIGNNDGTRRIVLHGANSAANSSELIFGDSTQDAPRYAGMGIRYSSDSNYLTIRSFYDANTSSSVDSEIVRFDRTTLESTFQADVTAPTFIGDLTGNADTATNADTVDLKHATDFTLDYVTDNNNTTTNSISVGRNINFSSVDYTYIEGNHTNAADGEWTMRMLGYAGGTFMGSFDIGRIDADSGFLRLRQKINGTNTDVVNVSDGNVNIITGNLAVGGTTVIDSSRNLTAVSGTFSSNLQVDDKITIKGTTNDLLVDETADGTWHIYDTFQDNGIKIYSSTGGMEFQYNGVTEMTIDGGGVTFNGTIDLSDANLNIGSADIVFAIDDTDTGARGLVWNFDADGNGTASNIGYIRSGGTLVGEKLQFNINAEGTITGSDAIYEFKNAGTDVVTINADGSVTASSFIGNVTGDLTGNADTASTWETVRSITIGDTAKDVDGSDDVAWSITEIGITKANIDALDINADQVDGLDATEFTLDYVTDNGNSTSNSITVGGLDSTGNINLTKDNVGIATDYGSFKIEATDAQMDLVSSTDGSWGSAINFVEGTDSTANANVWSIARRTTAGNGGLYFNYGTNNSHSNTERVVFSNSGDITASGNIQVDDKITIKGTTNDLLIDETADGTWHIYDTFQDNGIKIHSTSDGLEFQYNGVTEMVIDGGGVRIIGGIDLSDANLDIGSADVIFGIDDTDTGARGLVWNFDADGNGTASNIGYIRAGGTLVGEVLQFNMNAEGTVTGSGSIYEFKNGGTDIFTIGADGSVTADSFIGDGSGLTDVDAETLDGLNSTQFLRSDANDSTSGTLNVNGGLVRVTGDASNIAQLILSEGSPDDHVIFEYDGTGSGDTNYFYMYSSIDTWMQKGDSLNIQPSTGKVAIGTTSFTEKFEVAGNMILDASNANLKIKAGATGTKGDIQWTFNTDSTVFASAGIEYDNRATDGFLIDSGYPITLDYATVGVRFTNNGSEKMRINNTGLGIGTDSPNAKLHVLGNTTNNQFILERIGTATGKYRLYTNNNSLWFYDDAQSEHRMMINSIGQVGIGNTSPSTGYKLHVSGSGLFSNAIVVNDVDTGNPSAASDQIRVSGYGILGNRGTFYITNPGTVQIGSGSIHNQNPTALFTASAVTLRRSTTVLGSVTATSSIKAQASSYIDVAADQTDSAEVKIGVSSGSTEGFVMTNNTGAGHIKQNTSIKMLTYTAAGSSVESARFTTSGVVIGRTSPAANLDVYEADNLYDPQIKVSTSTSNVENYLGLAVNKIRYFRNANTGVNFEIETDTASTGTEGGHIVFKPDNGTAPTERMRIQRNGRVGIGVTQPSYTLHVGGNVGINSALFLGRVIGQPNIKGVTDHVVIEPASNSNNVYLCNYTSGDVILANGGGDVSIGNATPSYKLDVTGTIRASGDVIAYSDARVKENVKTIDNALDKVTKLRGVEYNKIGETEQKIGVIAQEIEQILPQVVQEDAEGMKSVAYGNIVGVLIEAIKEQQKQIDELKARLDGTTN